MINAEWQKKRFTLNGEEYMVSESNYNHAWSFSLLETILIDLTTDLKNSIEVLEYETVQDSILKLVMEGKLTAESYKNSNYVNNISTVQYFEISDNGYTNLAKAIDEVPERFKEAYNTLSILHSEHKPHIKKVNDYILDFAFELEKKWASTQTWYAKFTTMVYQNRYDPIPEMVQYLLNDEFHKNDAASLYIILQNHKDIIFKYKHQAVLSYISIHKLLEKDNDLPDFITSYMIDLPTDSFHKYEGTYVMEESDAIKVQIAYKNGKLIWTQFGGNAGEEGYSVEIFPQSEVEFFAVSAFPLKVFFEENGDGDIMGQKVIFGEQEVNFVKSD